jgi:hypothetical protein
MKKTAFAFTAALTALVSASTSADTLELANGTLLEGEFVGFNNGIYMFRVGGDIQAHPEEDVVGIYNSEGVANRESRQAAAAATSASAPTTVTVPAGTRLVLRTTDSIDSRRHQAGHRFRAQLESALVVDGVTAAPRGTLLHGRITQASQGGRAIGSAEMAIEFTDIMIDDQLFEIATQGMQARTDNEARNTLGRTARAAAIGGLISGRSGARTGAAVGVGASLLTSGQSINVPAGTILETNLRVPVTLPR